jgi:hypothetical protein
MNICNAETENNHHIIREIYLDNDLGIKSHAQVETFSLEAELAQIEAEMYVGRKIICRPFFPKH